MQTKAAMSGPEPAERLLKHKSEFRGKKGKKKYRSERYENLCRKDPGTGVDAGVGRKSLWWIFDLSVVKKQKRGSNQRTYP